MTLIAYNVRHVDNEIIGIRMSGRF